MSGKIFISHSDHDRPLAESLLRALEKRSITCWIAPRDIPPGGSYAEAILTAIERCGCFVLVYTDHCNSSGHVLREVERALNYRKNIVPIRFDDSVPSKSLDYLLATVHWLSVPTEQFDALESAAAQVARCLQSDQPSSVAYETALTSSAPGAQKPIHRSSKIIWVSVGLLLLCALVAGALVFFRMMNRSPAEQLANRPIATSTIEPSATASPPSVAPASPSQANAVLSPAFSPQRSIVPVADPTPEEVLQRYFASFRTRDVVDAYNLLSGRFRGKLTFNKFTETFNSTRDMRLIQTKEIRRTTEGATIEVFFEETQANSRRVYWRGPIDLVREPQGWRIETLRALKIVPE